MMRAKLVGLLAVALAGGASITARAAQVAESEMSVTTVPVKYVFVDENAGKFSAHHWMKDGYTGGIKHYSGNFKLSDGTEIEALGHAMIDAGDIGTELSIKKENLGYFNFDHSQFRKYFDSGAGVHRQFATIQNPDTDKDLRLNIGKFGFETGLTLENFPQISFGYEREFKEGAKSRLTWALVKEGVEARFIGPAWQEINETVDAFELKASEEIAGFTLHGEQRWEFARTETFREEKSLATTGAASDNKIRQQNQGPQSILLATTLGGERSFLEDKVFTSSGYHFNRLKNREIETLEERSAAGVITNFSRAENKINARADSDYDSHTWVQNFMVSPWQALSFGAKLKSEVITRHSNSTYPGYSESSATPEAFDQVLDHTEVSLSDVKASRWGEGFSLRFSGIPRTALYTELEFEQSRMLMREDRTSVDGPDSGNDAVSGEVFQRETVTEVRRGAWTLGGRTSPWRFLDVTSQVRRRIYNNDQDDQRETAGSGRSAFFDGQSTHTNEFSTRVTLKPWRWLKPSFRYQLRADKYATRAEAQQIVKTNSLSNIYTFDVMVQPLRDLTTVTTFSRQTASTSTPAQLIGVSPSGGLPRYTIPAFNADVNSWLFTADYAMKSNISLSSTLQYTWANNFNDYSASGQPYGAQFDKLDLMTSMKWAINDRTSVGTEYELYTYNPNENVENGGYTAHVIWFDITQRF